MTLEIKSYSSLCELEVFRINGVKAEYEDFGTKEDRDKDHAEPYCCKDMRFIGREPTNEVLKKYSITREDYATIVQRLEESLSFGQCGWCE